MTEVMTMSSTAGVNLSTYTYTSAPRPISVINSRKTTGKNAGNPMYDRRVVRGSNFKREEDGLPKWNPYFANAGSLSTKPPDPPETKSRIEFRQKLEARARLRRESYGVYPSHSSRYSYSRPNPRINAHSQTEHPYEPLERPPEREAQVQTDPWLEDRGPPPQVISQSVGVDASTQVYEDELTRISSAENAMVAALVGRTMREAALEVAHEEQVEEERLARLAPPALSTLSQHGSSDNGKEEEESDDAQEEDTRQDQELKDTSANDPSPEEDEENEEEEEEPPNPPDSALLTEGHESIMDQDQNDSESKEKKNTDDDDEM